MPRLLLLSPVSPPSVLVLVLVALLFMVASVSGFSSPIQPHTTATTTSRHIIIQHKKLFVASSSNSPRYMSSPKTTAEETTTTTSSTSTRQQEVMEEASDALASVGWAPPREDGEMTSDDPFVRDIDAGIQRDMGVGLDELLNPAKVVNLERDLYNLRLELATLTGVAVTSSSSAATTKEDDNASINNSALTTEACDGGGGGDEADAIRAKIEKKEKDLLIERRSVFRGWLKNVFLVQAILSFGLSFVMATSPETPFGGFGWFQSYNM